MSQNKKSLDQIINFRLEKLEKLRGMGIDPYPHKYFPTHFSSDIIKNFSQLNKKNVNVAGRIMSIRKMGKASFFHIQDSKGKIQIFIKQDEIGDEFYNHFKLLDIGDYVGIIGYVFKTKMDEVSIHASELVILCKSIRPLPIVKEKDDKTFDAFLDK